MLLFVLLLQLWRDVRERNLFLFYIIVKQFHFTVPGPPTNLMAMPSMSICNEVLFNWNLPPEDERNGILICIIIFNY